jgi:hypothetical protein
MAIQEIVISIKDVKLKKINSFHKSGIVDLFVEDEQFGDRYKIRLERSNLGLGAMCSLNGRPSYQADSQDCRGMFLKDIINKIAAGEMIDENGIVVDGGAA